MVNADFNSVPEAQPAITPKKAETGQDWLEPAPNGDNASCKNHKSGRGGGTGNDGGDGVLGKDGVDGTPAGNMTIRSTQINGQLTLSAHGGAASGGQDAGDGGSGQEGGNGGASANCDWPKSDQNGGAGGKGGNGGNGAKGGKGGNGGDGSIVSVLYAIPPTNTPSISASSGAAGAGGLGGSLGVPGPGGFGDAGSGDQAAEGIVGENGHPGSPGETGLPPQATIQSSSPPPILTGISPETGSDNTSVTIEGDYFQDGATVMIGLLPLGNIEVISADKITGTIPACPRCYKVAVMVTNPDDGCGAIEDMFTYS
ncbi:MAG: IPT/TIG domain-containing protein [Phycisphaeraceae bacterium]|nr:IPT/TIG domain-containing protein [Phycisphaeraceae bacterium]